MHVFILNLLYKALSRLENPKWQTLKSLSHAEQVGLEEKCQSECKDWK